MAGLVQLSLLAYLSHHGWASLPANALAFVIAIQLNFALSNVFTWRDRMPTSSLWQRWLLFHASIAGTALLNMSVFAVSRLVLPTLAASALGIAVAAIGNFAMGDRLVFRAPIGAAAAEHDETEQEP